MLPVFREDSNLKNDGTTCLQYVDVEFLLQVCKIVLCTSHGEVAWPMSASVSAFMLNLTLMFMKELESRMKMLVCRQGN